MNHFIYESFCDSDNFTHISEELNALNKLIVNKSNVLLYSKRKFGKTSLIKEFFDKKINKDENITIYIDLFNIVSAIDFIKMLYKQIASSLPYDNKSILRELRIIFTKVNFTANMKDDGSLEFDVSLLSYNPKELIMDVYKGLKEIHTSTNKQIIIAFDDFWQIKLIKNFKIDAILKEYIQDEQHINYIFTGTKHRLLIDMFSKRKMPLFNMAEQLELKAIPIEQFYQFIDHRLQGRISYDIFQYIYNITEGEAKLIQEFCYHLSNKSNKTEKITINDIDEVCLFLLNSKSEYFKMILNRLTFAQKIALKAVIMSEGIDLYTKNNLFKLQVTKASLNTAIKYLYLNELIDKQDNKYYISNKCFELWCRRILVCK
ncbi:MAG: ATP-binding protein [Arcobacteraceae bacterium]|nr:ATP-binding protein [Arcobacteraceae bacterium]